MTYETLFSPLTLGNQELNNRIVMAPMTRSRTQQPGDIPTASMAEYYSQRASAGLIISEATQISPQGQGYSFTPGIYSRAQIQGWKQVTDKVHQAGGRIFLQLWHVGRMSHPSFHADGKPVAPSALAPDAQVWIVDENGNGHMQDCPIPRALTIDEITAIINDYRQAALNAMEAGFDGVEIHGANGYLIDQFLRRSSNHRTDQYGGTQHKRIRFALNIVNAVTQAIGADKVGIRLAPFIMQRGMHDEEAPQTILLAAQEFEKMKLAYIHLAEADWDDAPVVSEGFRLALRQCYSGRIIVAGHYTAEKARRILQKNFADLVAFGRPFIANPDLPERLRYQWPLSTIRDTATLFGGNHTGYTDYPPYETSDNHN